MRTRIIPAGILFAALPAFAYEPHSYTYLEVAYWDQTEDAGSSVNGSSDIESDGYSVVGSYRFDAGVLLQAYYSDGEVDKAFGYNLSSLGIDMDIETFGIFIGGANQVNDRVSVWGGVGYANHELDISVAGLGSASGDTDQWLFGAGARYWLFPMVELNGSAALVHFDYGDDTDTDGEVALGLRFQPFPVVSLGLSYSRLIDLKIEQVKADLRWQF